MADQICVDTDIIIDHLRGKGPGVSTFEKIVRTDDPFITSINKLELLCGARDEKETGIIEQALAGFTLLPFDEACSREASRIYRELKGKGRLIGVRDIMIAGAVLANNLTFATKNLKEFEKIKGLKLMKVKG